MYKKLSEEFEEAKRDRDIAAAGEAKAKAAYEDDTVLRTQLKQTADEMRSKMEELATREEEATRQAEVARKRQDEDRQEVWREKKRERVCVCVCGVL